MTRTVIVFALADTKEEWCRIQLRKFAERVRVGDVDEHDRDQLADALLSMAAGRPADKIFGFAKKRGGQPKFRLHKWEAIDYWLRRRMGESNADAAVAVDWNEKSVDTVSDIARRYRSLAESTIDRWSNEYPLELYANAVASARVELLTGKAPPITKTASETIEIVWDFEDALFGPVSPNESVFHSQQSLIDR